MIELLERVATMLGYIELLGRALTPSENEKVHDLLVDVEHEWAKMQRASILKAEDTARRRSQGAKDGWEIRRARLRVVTKG